MSSHLIGPFGVEPSDARGEMEDEARAARLVCGYCRASFKTDSEMQDHDNAVHDRRGRLESERNVLNNMFGFSAYRDGKLRDRIAEIDVELSK